MKLNNSKIVNKKFDPIRHWYMLLLAVFVIFVGIIAYGFYSFFYIKSQISLIELESKNNIQNSTSADFLEKSHNNTKFIQDINNLNNTLDVYEKKEIEYNRLINNSVKAVVSTSTIIASTTVATSTK